MLSLLLSAQEEKSDKERWQHLADLADFALAMKDTLTNINNQSFNNFMLRIGKGSKLAGPLLPSAGDSANQQEGLEAWRELRHSGWGESRSQSWKGP